MAKRPSNWAKVIGHGFAHVQHGIDKLTIWGFKKMREAAKDAPKKDAKDAAGWKGKTKIAAKRTFSFLGETGDEFYKKYEELKKQGT